MRPPLYAAFGYVAAASAAAYLHYFGLYLIGLQGVGAALFLLLSRPRSLAYLCGVYALILLAYAPWVPALLEDLGTESSYIRLPEGFVFLEYLAFLFNVSRTAAVVFGVLCLLLLAREAYAARASGRGVVSGLLYTPGALLVLWLVVPFAGAFAQSALSTPSLTFRNLIISLPAAYLLLSRAIVRLAPGRWGAPAVATLMVAVALAHLLFYLDYYSEPHKEQFREAVAYVVENDARYRDSVVVACAWNEAYFDYYFERLGSERRVEVEGCEPGDLAAVERVVRSEDPEYLWYLRSDNRARGPHYGASRKFLREFREGLEPVAHVELLEMNVWLFERAEVR
jgi:mannosyltransferase